MSDSPDFHVLEIDYPGLVTTPAIWLERIPQFLGASLDTSAMAACIKSSLHHNRAPELAVR